MIQFFTFSITLLSAAFSLGAVTHLFIRYRTAVLRLMMLFLISLLSITAAFWIDSPFFREIGIFSAGINYLLWFFQLIGSGLNIIIIPHLTAALISVPIKRWTHALLWIWNSCFILFALAWFLLPRFEFIPVILSIQQVATIFGSLVFMATGFRRLRKTWWRKALLVFFGVSIAFLLLLILDLLITRLPISALAPIDNLSLPVYLIVLNPGVFYFSGKYLSREALVEKGKLTGHCIDLYGLTNREQEILEELILGRKNKEIAEKFFISVKTVENHLYSMYQKIGVTSRLELMHTLHNWSRG